MEPKSSATMIMLAAAILGNTLARDGDRRRGRSMGGPRNPFKKRPKPKAKRRKR